MGAARTGRSTITRSAPYLTATVDRSSRVVHAVEAVVVLAAHLLGVVVATRGLDAEPLADHLVGLALAVTVAGIVRAGVNRPGLVAEEMPGPSRPATATAVLVVMVFGLVTAALGAPTWLVAVPVVVALVTHDRFRHLAWADGRHGLLIGAELVWVGAMAVLLSIDDPGSYVVSFDLETEQGLLVLWALAACLSTLVLAAGMEEVASGEDWVGPGAAWFLADHLFPVGALAAAGLAAASRLPIDEWRPVAVSVALVTPGAAAQLAVSSRWSPLRIADPLRAARVVAGFGVAIVATTVAAVSAPVGSAPRSWSNAVLGTHAPRPQLVVLVGATVTVWSLARCLSAGAEPAPGPGSSGLSLRDIVAPTGGGLAAVVVAQVGGSAMAAMVPLLAAGCWLAVVGWGHRPVAHPSL